MSVAPLDSTAVAGTSGRNPADTAGPPTAEPADRIRRWREIVARHAKPDTRRAVAQLLNTGLPFLAALAAMLWALDHGIWAALLLVLPAAALLVRLFAIQHDCGHGSFFRSRRANDLFGRALGVLTLTPYTFWRRSHAAHHAASGNLDRRGIGDITTLTVREYLSLPGWRRLVYRLYRHPIVLFGIGPAYQFLIRHRIPTGNPLRERQAWLSVLGTNAAIAAILAPLGVSLGVEPLMLGYLPVMLIAGSIGVWLFYVQHQFEDTYWETAQRWEFPAAALEGSSFYDLPPVLRWLTGSIGFHHIHHLCSRIPNYRLRTCFEQEPELRLARRLTLRGSLKSARLALWEEGERRLVPFRHLRRGPVAPRT